MAPTAKIDYDADILEVLKGENRKLDSKKVSKVEDHKNEMKAIKQSSRKAVKQDTKIPQTGLRSTIRRSAQTTNKPSKSSEGMIIYRYFTKEGDGDPLDLVEYEKRTTRIVNTDGSVIFEMKDAEVPKAWSQVASDVLVSKYFRKDGIPVLGKDGKPKENADGTIKTTSEHSVKQVISRMAGCWRYWGEKHGYFNSAPDAQAFEDEIKHTLIHQMCAPNSPQWFNTGLNWAYGITGPAQGHFYFEPNSGEIKKSQDAYTHPQPHACFIQSVKDDLINEGGIMDLVVREARVFKYGSGTGTNFSALRGEGEPLSGGGQSSGLMSWLKILDRSAGAIKSGGTTRRAAKMACLDIDHPDIEKFITWKKDEEKKVAALVAAGYDSDFNGEAYQTISGQNANNSIRVSKEFMQAVRDKDEWPLRWRTDRNHISKTLKAKDLWASIVDAAWYVADPGLQYDTTINEWHTCPASGKINASNPCSEYMFLDDTACNLASINLGKFYDEQNDRFDVESFRHTVFLWTVVLEISVLMAQFVSEPMARNSYDFRTLGLGYANLGTLLMTKGLPYDSDEARTWAAAITSIMTGEAYTTSAALAKFLGPFPKFNKNRAEMLRVIRNHRRAAYNAPEEEYEGLTIIPRGIDKDLIPGYMYSAATQTWDKALELGRQYGYRNAQATLIAPTGTIGLVMDCDTTGVEPDFALVKFKKLAGGGYWKIVNQSVPKALERLGYSSQEIDDIIHYIAGHNTLENAPINHQILVQKGLTAEDIAKIEAQLPGVFEIGFAFNRYALGDTTMERLGFSKEEYTSAGFDMLRALGFDKEQIDATNEYVCGTMTPEGAPHLKEEHLAIFDCASRCGKKGTRSISYMGHLKMMAAVQPFLSGAISKTINLPNEATKEDIADAYWQGWELGLKANAIYRDGSKLSQPLSAKSDSKDSARPDEATAEPIPQRKRPPKERQSITRKVTIGGYKLYLTVGLYPDGKPAEIFVNMAQEGSFASGMADAFAKITSIGLQYGVPPETIIKQLEHMRFDPHGFTGDSDIPFATSVADFIAQWLRKTFTAGGAAKMRLPLAEESTLDKDDNGNGTDHTSPIAAEPAPAASASQETIFDKNRQPSQADIAASAVLGDGPPCPECGAVMTPNGRCHKCPNCGTTSGCS